MGAAKIRSTGPEPLQNDHCKAILVLRLGAALNSVRAAQRWTNKLGESEDLAGQFDRFQSYLVAAAYLAEACKLFWKNQGCILELARKGHAKDDEIQKLISDADPGTGVQANLLSRIRDKETLHWDCAVFEKWASAQKAKVVWVKCSGQTAGECVMWASYDALTDFTTGLNADKSKPVQDRINDQIPEVLKAMDRVTHVFECAVAGFLGEHLATQEDAT